MSMPSPALAGARLLLVDDEPHIVRGLAPGLKAEGYGVEVADCGEAALVRLAREPFDLVILDLGLPDMDGKQVLARLREWSDAAVIVLSARRMEGEKIAALDAGADDYVSKPFSLEELMARIRVSLRGRAAVDSAATAFEAFDLRVEFASGATSVQGEVIALSPRERDLMRTLARHAGRPVTHRQAMAAVWGPNAPVDNQAVRELVALVRQKIEAEPSQPRYLLNDPGVGYRLAAP